MVTKRYGVLGLKQFFLFNKDIAQSITGNCAFQLQQLITQAEKIFANRVILRDDNELMDYFLFNSNMVRPENFQELESFFNVEHKLLSKEELINKINNYITYTKTDRTDSLITLFVDRILENEFLLTRFSYLNDINKFLSSTTFLTDFIVANQNNILSLKDFNEHEFESKLKLELNPYLITYLFDASTQERQLDLCEGYQRKVVLMSDINKSSPTINIPLIAGKSNL